MSRTKTLLAVATVTATAALPALPSVAHASAWVSCGKTSLPGPHGAQKQTVFKRKMGRPDDALTCSHVRHVIHEWAWNGAATGSPLVDEFICHTGSRERITCTAGNRVGWAIKSNGYR